MTSATTVMATTIRPPPPSPCTVRARMRKVIELAIADKAAPIRKMTMATCSTILRP
ncbi:hypothetical protein D9M68_933020 [compost metagenome]